MSIRDRAKRAPLAAVWAAGAVLTAVGMYSVARACGLPWYLAWLYSLAADGLGLVAYRAATDLTGFARAYAVLIVMACTGLSAAVQSAHLRLGAGLDGAATPGLRTAVGAAPAVAVALAAHLHWLTTRTPAAVDAATGAGVPALLGDATGPGGFDASSPGPAQDSAEGASSGPGTAGREGADPGGWSSPSPAPEQVPASPPLGAGTVDPGRPVAVTAGRATLTVVSDSPADTTPKTAVPASGHPRQDRLTVRADSTVGHRQDTPPGHPADTQTPTAPAVRTDTTDTADTTTSGAPATPGQRTPGQPDRVSAALLSGLSVRDVVRATGATKSHVEKCRGELVAAGHLPGRGRQ